MSSKPEDLEDRWASLKLAISEVIARVDAGFVPYSAAEFTSYWTILHYLCSQKLPHNNGEWLYNRCKDALSNYCKDTVLPHLKDKHDQYLLEELTQRWPKYLSMIEHISRLFGYLNLLIIESTSLPNLKDTALACFYSLVYTKIHARGKDAILVLIENDRKREKIDCALLDKSIEFCAAIKCLDFNNYAKDFETSLVKQRLEYHSQIASAHVSTIEVPEYIIMADQYLNKEDAWASSCLDEGNHSSLMRKEDFKRIYNLFRPGGSNSVTLLFKKSVDEGIALHKVDESHSKQVKGLSRSYSPVPMRLSPASLTILLLVMFLCVSPCASTMKHNVGGKQGWAPNVNYTDWASHHRFFVGDWLVFYYQERMYDIVQVNVTGFEACSAENPIMAWNRGHSFAFHLKNASEYYFICSRGHCHGGMKLAVFVQEIPVPTPSRPSFSGRPPH